jgi:hypothetical protein
MEKRFDQLSRIQAGATSPPSRGLASPEETLWFAPERVINFLASSSGGEEVVRRPKVSKLVVNRVLNLMLVGDTKANVAANTPPPKIDRRSRTRRHSAPDLPRT